VSPDPLLLAVDINAQQLADDIRKRFGRSSDPIGAYWVQVTGDRDEYAAALEREFATEPVVVLVVRQARFDNPNAVLADFVGFLDQHQDACKRQLADVLSGFSRSAVVMLARDQLRIPQISSPVTLPGWYPAAARQLSITLEDLTWRVEAAINCPDAAVADLCLLAFEVEGDLLRRLGHVHDVAPSETGALAQIVNRSPDLTTVLSQARQAHAAVNHPSAFRPSLASPVLSLASQLWQSTRQHNSLQLNDLGKALAEALALPDPLPQPWHESLFCMLVRPSRRAVAEPVRFSANLCTALAAACQFVTATMHADQYGRYPIVLTRSVSHDLRATLGSACLVLAALDPVVGAIP
jgi:hypothetical protein